MSGLVAHDVIVDFIGNDEMGKSAFINHVNVNFYNLRGDQSPEASLFQKVSRVVKYYARLFNYSRTSDADLFHILWLGKFVYFERIFFNIYYKALGKKIAFTAHNVNAAERDGKDNFMNRWSLKFMYGLVDHIFVHTEKMKTQMKENFRIKDEKITVIPFGINNAVPDTAITPAEARKKLRIKADEKVLLFFGNVVPYKGLDVLIKALQQVRKHHDEVKLIIAGRIARGHGEYWRMIQGLIGEYNMENCIAARIEYIPDEDVELYFKAADVLVLPYKFIFQSGVMFLSYSFGLPVIATDAGSLSEYVIEGETGFACRADDDRDLACKIDAYFTSALYAELGKNREKIKQHAWNEYSWTKIAGITCSSYKAIGRSRSR